MTSQRQTGAVSALLRMLARLMASNDPSYDGAIVVCEDECMRALDRLCDALPAGAAQDRAMQQLWDVSPTPPDARTLRRWATEWDHYSEAAEAA